MLLKLNKEGPFKKDVFRAPGHQGNMRKLIHFLQQVSLYYVKQLYLVRLPYNIEKPYNTANDILLTFTLTGTFSQY